MSPVSPNELVKYINDLKPHTATGSDQISTITIKAIKTHIVLPLLHIINTSFETGTYPHIFKTAVIKLIFKKGDKTLTNNYRPVCILTIFSKLHEKCIKRRIYNFLGENKLISPNQFGFRSNMGTEDAIINLTTQINYQIDNNKKPLAVFLDLAKAFDTISHSMLVDKLYNIGIRGVSLALIKSYLQNREQVVSINNVLSKPRIIKYGIPQGTVLGPILFNVFINDLSQSTVKCEITSFADDTVLLFSTNSWKETHEVATSELIKVKQWLDNNLLTLNSDKTTYITFSPRKNTQPVNSILKLHNPVCKQRNPNCKCHVLEKQYSTRYLGIIIDQHLKWEDHIDFITKKLRCTIIMFHNLKNILTHSNQKLVYFGLVQSRIQYGIIAWGSAYDHYLQQLMSVQNVILKIIQNKEKRFSTEALYEIANVFPVRKLFVASLNQFVYRHKLTTPCSNKEKIITRSKTNKHLFQIRVNKGITQRHPIFLSSKLYNLIPLHIRNIESNKGFKYSMKKWMKMYPMNKLNNIINCN